MGHVKADVVPGVACLPYSTELFANELIKLGKAANVFLIDKNLWHRFDGFARSVFQRCAGDAIGVNINITPLKIILRFADFFSQLFYTCALRAACATKDDGIHTFSINQTVSRGYDVVFEVRDKTGCACYVNFRNLSTHIADNSRRDCSL